MPYSFSFQLPHVLDKHPLNQSQSQQELIHKDDIARDVHTVKKTARHYFFKISGARIPIKHKQYVSVFFGLPAASKSSLIASILKNEDTAHAIHVCQDEVKKSHPQFQDVKRLCGPSWSQELDDVGLQARIHVMDSLLQDGHSMICEGATSFILPVEIAKKYNCDVKINARLIPNVLVYRNNLTRMIQQKEKGDDVRGYTFQEYTGEAGYIARIQKKVSDFFNIFPNLTITAYFQYFDGKERKEKIYNAAEFSALRSHINHSDEGDVDLQNNVQHNLDTLCNKWAEIFAEDLVCTSNSNSNCPAKDDAKYSIKDYLNFEFGHYHHISQ